jgi:hypothetical protein
VFYFLIGLVLIQTGKDALLRKMPLQQRVLKKPTVMCRHEQFALKLGTEDEVFKRKWKIKHTHGWIVSMLLIADTSPTPHLIKYIHKLITLDYCWMVGI